jgi:hypothetical protein
VKGEGGGGGWKEGEEGTLFDHEDEELQAMPTNNQDK